MSSRLLLFGLLLLLGPGCSDQGAVKLTVTLEGFKPRCVRLRVEDPENADRTRQTKDLVEELVDKAKGSTLTVAAFRKANWSNNMRLTAQSFEGVSPDNPLECSGTPVSSQVETIALARGGRAEVAITLSALDEDNDGFASTATHGTDCDDTKEQVFPGQREVCNDLDDNCVAGTDEGFLKGPCSTDGCSGTYVCNSPESSTCNAPTPVTYYRDADLDGHGNKNQSMKSCNGMAPAPSYVLSNDDCDDTRKDIYKDAPELCDSVDNDCDDLIDEGYNLGAVCDNGCASGQVRCKVGDVNATECDAPRPTTWYPDEDRDGHGKTTGGVSSCTQPTGYVALTDDCNDGNPFTYQGAPELCDGEDNDCDNAVDEGSCGGAQWTESTIGSQDWRSVGVASNGKMWMVGGADQVLTHPSGLGGFDNRTGSCGASQDWHAVSVNPNNATVYLGGNGDQTAEFAILSLVCTTQQPALETNVRGIFERSTSSSFETYLVGLHRSNLSLGQAWRLIGRSPSTPAPIPIPKPLFDVHGTSREGGVVFAVGGSEAPSEGFIYRYDASTNNWINESIPSGMKRLRGIWVVHDKLAYAVGEGNGILQWDGSQWIKLNGPPMSQDLLAVRAFGTNAIHVVTSAGRVYSYGPTGWRLRHTMSTGGALFDIAGLNPGELWVAGAGGRIARWR